MIQHRRLIKPALILAGHFVLTFTNAQLRGDFFNQSVESGRATLVYVHNDLTSYVKENSFGQEEGILVDVMKEFEKYLDINYGIEISSSFEQVAEKDFHQFMKAVKGSSGGVFGLSNVSITEERKKDYNFSNPYIENVTVLLSHSSVTSIASLDEIKTRFEGMKAYSVDGSTYLSRLEEIQSLYYPTLEIELLPSGLDVIEKIASDEKAFGVVDLSYYIEFLEKGYSIRRHKVGDKADDKFGIIMPKNSDWSPVLKEFLQVFTQSVEYRKIISNHLGKHSLRLIPSDNSKL